MYELRRNLNGQFPSVMREKLTEKPELLLEKFPHGSSL